MSKASNHFIFISLSILFALGSCVNTDGIIEIPMYLKSQESSKISYDIPSMFSYILEQKFQSNPHKSIPNTHSDKPSSNSPTNSKQQYLQQQQQLSPASSSVSANLSNYHNNQYRIEIFIGDTKQPVELLLDTGSSASIVESNQCQVCKQKSIEAGKLYNCAASKTCKRTDQNPFTLKFGQGSAQGYMTSDTMCVGAQEVCSSEQMEFILIEDESEGMTQNVSHGILGLGLSENNPNARMSIVMELFEKKVIAEPAFSLYVSSINEDRRQSKATSKLILGGGTAAGFISQEYLSANSTLEMHGIISSKEWIVKVDQFEFVNGVKFVGVTRALIDSGTSLIVLPAEQYNLVLKSFSQISYCEGSGQGGAIRCSCPTGEIKPEQFHPLKIHLGSKEYELQASEYVHSVGSVCEVSIAGGSTVEGQIILGDVFLRKYFSYFNLRTKQIGLGLAAKPIEKTKELMKPSLVVLYCLLGATFLAILIIYLIRMISGLKNAKDEILMF